MRGPANYQVQISFIKECELKMCENSMLNKLFQFYTLLTVHLDVILVIDQLDVLFLTVFISCLYMFRATSANHQEDQLVSIHHLV
jgi:hypothetical protein